MSAAAQWRPVGIRIQPCDRADRVVTTVRRAEELGFDAAWFPDSQLLWHDVFTTLTAAHPPPPCGWAPRRPNRCCGASPAAAPSTPPTRHSKNSAARCARSSRATTSPAPACATRSTAGSRSWRTGTARTREPQLGVRQGDSLDEHPRAVDVQLRRPAADAGPEWVGGGHGLAEPTGTQQRQLRGHGPISGEPRGIPRVRATHRRLLGARNQGFGDLAHIVEPIRQACRRSRYVKSHGTLAPGRRLRQ
jgi:hypothetical protein